MQRSRKSILVAATALVAALAAIAPASAYTDKEIAAIFQILDINGDGKFTREEFSANNVTVIYRNVRGGSGSLTFEQTGLSRHRSEAAR